MIEVFGDLFEADPQDVGLICITTNGVLSRGGHAVMGAGIAFEAKKQWPGIERALGFELKAPERDGGGNHVQLLTLSNHRREGKRALKQTVFEVPWHIASFPTKHHWRDPSNLALIQRSCTELRALVDRLDNEPVFRDLRIALPRPGCRNGWLHWSEVCPVVADVLVGSRYLVMEKIS